MTLSVPKVIFVISSRSLFDRIRHMSRQELLGPENNFSATGREAFERSLTSGLAVLDAGRSVYDV
jgi:hypothetical protein